MAQFSFAPYAEEYASLGLPVIMVKVKDKVSAMTDWPNVATTDPAVAHEWWSGKNRLFNIGVVMGDRAGIIDIETDNHNDTNGEDSLMDFVKKAGIILPDTWTFKSGSGGIHRLFRCNQPIASGAAILPGVDVRANGGYAVFPPSVHPNGNQYEWLEGSNPSAMPDGPADLPACLLRLLTQKASTIKRVADDHSIGILLVHHLKKGKGEGDAFERISGTNGIFGSADTAIVMQKANRADKETTLHITGRDVIADDSVIEFNKDSCRWECKGSVDEIEERRLTLEYENDLVVRTVKHLLEDNLVWEGTASDLFDACIDFTGTPPDKSPDSLGKKIRATAKMLYLRDQILYFPPGKNGGAGGRKHKFRKSEK